MHEAIGGELAAYLAHATTLALTVELRATRGMEEGPARLRAVLAVVRALDRQRRAQLDEERVQRDAERVQAEDPGQDRETPETAAAADEARWPAEPEDPRAGGEAEAGHGQPAPARPPVRPAEEVVAALMVAAMKLEPGTSDEQAAAVLEEAARTAWHPPQALQAA
ncbi:MAG: hypothetical protein NTV51_04125 [Verrucomicrobia bacterium]|nr:hypothetical protein [Verrucomicrobiota bacterium]